MPLPKKGAGFAVIIAGVIFPYADEQRVKLLFEPSLALIYAGLTRLKRSPIGSCLTVVSSIPELADFGRGWEFFEEKSTFTINSHVIEEDCGLKLTTST